LKNIAIFMPRFIGDCINTTPALALIRKSYPDAKIHLVMQSLAIPVFERDERFNIVNYDRSGNKLTAAIKLSKTLKEKKIEASVLFTSKFIDALIAKLAGSSEIVGHNTESRGIFLTKKLRLETGRHYINRYAYIANLLCNNEHKELSAVHIFHDKNNSKIQEKQNINIGISILNNDKKSRHLPVEKTIEIIQQLQLLQDSDFHYYMLGSPAEQEPAESVTKGCVQKGINNITNLAGRTSVTELVDSIATLDLLISVDSSPLHIAAATKTPVIVLDGKSASPLSAVLPKGKQAIMVHNRGHYINDNDQIKDIDPEDVVLQVIQLMKNS